ncbi:YheC/YheD family endospore coat-associated protein [Pseudalkalibacillus sp. Hm43]|uniref:YheC/YheD family endospore coat-associated protein n=1 Tax=Pseudalkalibacillus sp. Hm43 TaxID=3450742 RepID=UPI003F43B78C
MIPLFYNVKKKQWFHREKGKAYTWGVLDTPISYLETDTDDETFKTVLHEKQTKLGPVVGILASSSKDAPFTGNTKTFQRFINHVHSHHGFAFVFTRSGIKVDAVDGYTLHPVTHQWIKIRLPYPDFVYNRIPSPDDEDSLEYEENMSWLNEYGIPFFNRSFLSKWETYLLLNHHVHLQPFLPETKRVTSPQVLRQMLKDHGAIILKPTSRSKGSGVLKLERSSNGKLQAFSNAGLDSFEDVTEFWKKRFDHTVRFIAQPFIVRKKIEGLPYDYRVLVQKGPDGWRVSGYGIRCAGKGKLTTHVPSGGTLLPVNMAPLHGERLNRLAIMIGKTLDNALGPICEFSIDLGIDQGNHCWIFEVNSKPMVFDEAPIQREWEKRWFEQVLAITGFSQHDINPLPGTHTIG